MQRRPPNELVEVNRTDHGNADQAPVDDVRKSRGTPEGKGVGRPCCYVLSQLRHLLNVLLHTAVPLRAHRLELAVHEVGPRLPLGRDDELVEGPEGEGEARLFDLLASKHALRVVTRRVVEPPHRGLHGSDAEAEHLLGRRAERHILLAFGPEEKIPVGTGCLLEVELNTQLPNTALALEVIGKIQLRLRHFLPLRRWMEEEVLAGAELIFKPVGSARVAPVQACRRIQGNLQMRLRRHQLRHHILVNFRDVCLSAHRACQFLEGISYERPANCYQGEADRPLQWASVGIL
mmetsp:Transcript_31866/g.80766  ORF Transcript_31866/g.80766 Transcript_31866/m.80766 type:complete len:291 (+) Transcript_31866:521-1393(+)